MGAIAHRPGLFRKRCSGMQVNPGDLEIFMEAEGRKLVEPGVYEIYAGGCCLDERVSATVELRPGL